MNDTEMDAWVTELENNPAEIREVLQQLEHIRDENEKLKELVLKLKLESCPDCDQQINYKKGNINE